MKAPDKIYVAELSKQHPSTEWCVGLACKTNNLPVATTEYIHKDALMELLNKKLQESADRLDFHANQAYAEVIDKLNSM